MPSTERKWYLRQSFGWKTKRFYLKFDMTPN